MLLVVLLLEPKKPISKLKEIDNNSTVPSPRKNMCVVLMGPDGLDMTFVYLNSSFLSIEL